MDNNEAQKKEDLLLDLYKIHAYIPNDEQGNPLTPFGNFCAGYEAAQQQSAGEIAELESELNDMTQVAMKLEPLIYEADALKADNERLREALRFYANGKNYTEGLEIFGAQIHLKDYGQVARQALAKTPPQHINDDVLIFTKDSLQEHDNEVIERCAKVCDESYAFDSDGFAKEIRALKT